mmetsp:Transcript_5752/g.12662  ORF Transcript_5752/g.12662 Transcript_5752/m.12662 type:complete len:247 (+) Transcript_5752:1130-1870(+)
MTASRFSTAVGPQNLCTMSVWAVMNCSMSKWFSVLVLQRRRGTNEWEILASAKNRCCSSMLLVSTMPPPFTRTDTPHTPVAHPLLRFFHVQSRWATRQGSILSACSSTSARRLRTMPGDVIAKPCAVAPPTELIVGGRTPEFHVRTTTILPSTGTVPGGILAMWRGSRAAESSASVSMLCTEPLLVRCLRLRTWARVSWLRGDSFLLSTPRICCGVAPVSQIRGIAMFFTLADRAAPRRWGRRTAV